MKSIRKENNMIPSPVLLELENLNQCEEKLTCCISKGISMQIYCKSSGCLNYKGHTITLSHSIQKIADILPNYPKDFP